MKNFITPNSHPSSFFSGSTLEAMVDKAKELGTGYYTCTDNGYLTNTLKAYNYAKEKDLKLIAGCELYFVDKECDIIKGTNAEKIKYYTVTVHAKTQDAYQYLVKALSDKTRAITHVLGTDYPVFNWKDLEEFSKQDFTLVTGGPQDIICKNLLVNEPVVAGKIFLKLKNLFKDNFYTSIVPLEFDKKWVTSSVFTFTDGQTVTLDSSIKAETQVAKTFRVSLEEVANKFSRHKTIKRIYVNGIGYNVNKDIVSACNLNDFKDIGEDVFVKYNNFIKTVSKKYGVKILLNDYSYLADSGDKLVQDLKLGEDTRIYTNYSIKNTEEILPYLQRFCSNEEINEFVENTYEWAGNFDDFELKYEYRMVKEHDDTLAAAMEQIRSIGRYDETNPVHVERLEHELSVIHSNGEIDLLPYFFPINKALNWYTERGRVVGPARGSAGGSFLMYCMGITQVDPIKYGLYFSRFLTLGRILKGTLPDVDVDLPDRELLVSKGGFLDTFYRDKWSQISTRSLMRLKSAIRDVNRFKKGKVEEEIETFAKGLEPAPQGVSDKDFVFGYENKEGGYIPGLLDKDDKLREYTEERAEEWEIVKKTLGITRQNGRHASAFVISDIPIADVIPIMKVSDSENVTQYEADEVEAAGLIKYDFLVVKCLNDIELALRYINDKELKTYEKDNYDAVGWYHPESEAYGCADCHSEIIWDQPASACSVVDPIFRNEKHHSQQRCDSCGQKLNDAKTATIPSGKFLHHGRLQYIWDLPEEPEVFNMLAEGKTETVFQLNTVSVTPYVQKIKPKTVEDCAVVTSLVRPGPLDFIDEKTGRNMAEEYIERVNGRSVGDIEILNKLLPETHGVFVFQEQITKLTKELTGWGDEKAEDVRIAVGKKKLKMILELKPQFIEASVENGIDEETAKSVWAMIETFGRYGFNKSHAVAYAMIAYACAYLKYHYPLEWWAAVLSNAEEKEITEVLWPYVKDILSPPDINLSKEEMVIDYSTGTIRNKLSVLRGLGEKVANRITEGRPYRNIEDFIEKKVVGNSLTRKLIHVGVLDSLFKPGLNLMEKMQAYEDAVEVNNYKNKIMDKSENEIFWNQPIEKFIEAAKIHPKTRRCKHVIKEGKIDLKYAFMNPIKDFLLKKSIFPTMPISLSDLVKENCKTAQIINTPESSYILDRAGREIRLVDGKTYQKITNIPCQYGSDQVVNFCLPAYIVDCKEFPYKNGEKKALKMTIDIDGYMHEFVRWPDYETGILTYPSNFKKGSIVFIFMYKKLGKEMYSEGISDLLVEDSLDS